MRWLGVSAVAAAIVLVSVVGAAEHVEAERLHAYAAAGMVGIEQPFDIAAEVQEEAEAWQAEQEETYLYEQSYGVETSYAPSYYDSSYDGMSDRDYIAFRESGGDYGSRNGRYIGKYQMDESRLDGDYSPEHQEEVAEAYMLDRYGSWEAAREFWDSHGWW